MKSSGIWGAWSLPSATLFAAISTLGTVNATENILVMGEDADGDYLSCKSRPFPAVRSAVAYQLGDTGFRVYDETALTMDDFEQGRCRRQDSELIDIARSITQSTIDVAVLFRIYAAARELDHTTRISARVEGRMLAVHSGQRLGNVEVSRRWNVSTQCDDECIVESVRERAQGLGEDLGALLAFKLSPHPTSSGEPDLGSGGNSGSEGRVREYTLTFKNFNSEEIEEINEFLEIFRCYSEHRPKRISPTHASYAYHSCISHAKLSSNLNRMLALMQKKSGNRWSANTNISGNKFTMRKIVRSNVKQSKKDDNFQW